MPRIKINNLSQVNCLKGSPIQASPGSQAGFTLLEVLVAAALMALMLVALLELLAAGLRTREAAQRRTQALMVAEKLCHDHYSRPDFLKAGIFQGREGPYAFRVTVEPQFQVAAEGLKSQVTCYSIKVAVSWQELGRSKSLEIQTVRTAARKKS